jgi:Bacterial pre-peptidase C-terminal domain
MRGMLWFGAATAALLMINPALAQDQAGDSSTSARLSIGEAIEGEITPAGDADWFRLRVEQGQLYALSLDGVAGEDGTSIDPTLTITDRDGNQLAFNDDHEGSLNAALNYIPSEDGDVFVNASGFGEAAVGRYRLNVSAKPLPDDDVANGESTRARVTLGQIASGNIEYEGDVDWYRLSARTGQRYAISLNATEGETGLGDPVVRVIDGDGVELGQNDDHEGLNSRYDFVPRENGVVFIEAAGLGGSHTGTYTLNVAAERLPNDNSSGDTRTRGRIALGETVNSDVAYEGDGDWYRVRLSEGESYRFTLSSAGDAPLGDTLLALHDDDGEQIVSDDDSGEGLNSYLEFTAPTTGNYFVAAGAFGGGTGGYTLTARAGDIPADSSTDASLSAEGDYRDGALGAAGDRDWYRIDLKEGQGLRVGLAQTDAEGGIGDPLLVIYGPDGAELARDDDGGEGLNSWMEFQALATGPHFVEARSFSEDAQGRYALTITAGEIGGNAESAEALLPDGEGRVSSIGAAGDVDWFSIELVEGRPYRFNLDSAEPGQLADPVLKLYNSEGVEVAADDDGGTGANAYLTFAATSGGTYYAAASGFDNATGRYSLRVSDTDVPGGANTDETLAAADDGRLSRVDMPGELDYYRVELEAGVRYQIEVRGTGDNPLADPFLAVMSEQNERVTSDDDSGPGLDARIRFTPEASGSFFLQASGLGGSTGWYQISIVRQ